MIMVVLSIVDLCPECESEQRSQAKMSAIPIVEASKEYENPKTNWQLLNESTIDSLIGWRFESQ